MSSPAPVPSKAAIHALRGLLFGTSCSLVLLAEERRQRIKIARSAVENGRKLKALKRYSTNRRSTLEVLQEEARTDANASGWSSRSRSTSSPQDRGEHVIDSPHLNHAVHDVTPNPRRPTRQTREIREREASRSLPDDETIPPPHQDCVPGAVERSSHDSWTRFPPSSSTMRHTYGVGDVATSGLRAGVSLRKNAVASIVDVFCRDNPRFRPEDDLHAGPAADPSHSSPSAALGLVRRAYLSTASSRELPNWLNRLSSLLCVACQQEGHLLVAGQILDVVTAHGPICLSDYLAHRPLELITSLLTQSKGQDLDDLDRGDCLRQAVSAYLANIVDFDLADSTLQQKYISTGKDIIIRALELKLPSEINRVFDRIKLRSLFSEANWFIEQLMEGNEPNLAIAAFTTLYASLDPNTESLSERIVDCAIQSRGYAALKVLETVNRLGRRDGWLVTYRWIADLLWQHWKCTGDYKGARKLFFFAEEHGFCGRARVLRKIIRVCIEANDTISARSYYERLCLLDPQASEDTGLLAAFAQLDANQGDWARVRARLETMKGLEHRNDNGRQEFNTTFITILQTYSKDHTWGETETFLEKYVQELGVTLDRNLVRFIADRHGKCRDVKAMARWLKFCKDAGFLGDTMFWNPFFISCRRDFKLSRQQMDELYSRLVSAGVLDEFPRIGQAFEAVTAHPRDKLAYRRAVSHRLNPADERTAWYRMSKEALHKNWAAVLATYNRAMHNNMGFSSRCLRVAVKAMIKLNPENTDKAREMLIKAQSEGNDVTYASVPLIMAEFDNIVENQGPDGRIGRPFDDVVSILSGLRDKGLEFDTEVFRHATYSCVKLRNYKEAVHLCVVIAQAKGNTDLCYSLDNFRYLLRIYVTLHDYETVRWLLLQLRDRDYRLTRLCRQVLRWSMNYLMVASKADKDDDLRHADLEMRDIISLVLKSIAEDNRKAQLEAQDAFIEALTKTNGKFTDDADDAEDDSDGAAPMFLGA